jgi:serine/threonine-protein kinase
VSTRPETSATIRRPLENALDIELRGIERMIARIWIALTAFGTLLAIVIAVAVDCELGVAMAVVGVASLLVFSLSAWRLERADVAKRISVLTAMGEGVLPWVCFGVLSYTRGAAYALASWVPPFVFAALLITWVARLRPLGPILVAASGATLYLVVYFVLVRPHVPTGVGHSILHDPPMQISRAFSMLVGGLLGAVVSRGLRRAIGRADVAVRREELFGKYRIVAKIGSGSGGSVHEAIYCPEGGFERRVAIKQLHAHLITEQAFVDGFRAEAELGARLAHPNVVTIHDFGRHQETFFMAMEFVDGLSLAKLAARARRAEVAWTPEIVGHIGRGVLHGLDHAHDGVRDEEGRPLRILHRDVCPQNLLVSRIGELKLTDFGIARVLGHTEEGASTRTIAGHEAYMAPEQIEAGALDLVTDLFAVGVILWELLANKRLFARENAAATLLAVIAAEVPPVTSLRGGVDSGWDAFLARALAKKPEDRFRSAREMLTALDAIPDARGDDASARLGELVTRFAVDRDPPLTRPDDATVRVTA